jgi:DNA-binding transcriptional MerR regulator
MAETTPHLPLKRAAERLGVHQQTLRSWDKRGLMRMIRLPRSHYRRVPVAEVERLQAAMGMAPPATGVRLAAPRQDPDSIAQAQVLAEAVLAELAQLEMETNFEQFMAAGRGRSWSP